jgi:hypothetical protein
MAQTAVEQQDQTQAQTAQDQTMGGQGMDTAIQPGDISPAS